MPDLVITLLQVFVFLLGWLWPSPWLLLPTLGCLIAASIFWQNEEEQEMKKEVLDHYGTDTTWSGQDCGEKVEWLNTCVGRLWRQGGERAAWHLSSLLAPWPWLRLARWLSSLSYKYHGMF